MGPAFLRASWVRDYLDVCGIFEGVWVLWWGYFPVVVRNQCFGGHLI